MLHREGPFTSSIGKKCSIISYNRSIKLCTPLRNLAAVGEKQGGFRELAIASDVPQKINNA